MATESRPRRVVRPTTKMPIELTSAKSAAGDVSLSGVSSEAPHKAANGKRRAPSEGEERMHDAKTLEDGVENDEKTARSKSGKGKSRAGKSKSAKANLYDIDFILTDPKSPLVNMDISDVINYDSWMSLSLESRERLCKLLPGIAFGERMDDVGELHPSQRRDRGQSSNSASASCSKDADSLHINGPVPPGKENARESSHSVDSLDASFFKDPHFESAARTFQDHLFTGWHSATHRELVEKHLSEVRSGAIHAPWKDDLWDRDHPEAVEFTAGADGTTIGSAFSDSIATGSEKRRGKEKRASEFDLLVRKGFVKQGDIIVLKHKFVGLGITIEKDLLVTAIHPKTSAVTLMSSPGTTKNLPSDLYAPFPSDPADLTSIRDMTVNNATQLVTTLLDIDGRIPRDQRPRMDAWKLLNLWQWPADMDLEAMSLEEVMLSERGGRECLGTLFYLRGQSVDD